MKAITFPFPLIALLIAIGCATSGQNTATNVAPAQPSAAAPTNTVDLAAQVAELKAQVAETSRLLAEYARANAELAAALKSAQSASAQPAAHVAPQQLQNRPPYYWDGQRYVPVVGGGSLKPSGTAGINFPNAPGRIVGVRVHPYDPGPGYYANVVNGRVVYSLAPNPR